MTPGGHRPPEAVGAGAGLASSAWSPQRARGSAVSGANGEAPPHTTAVLTKLQETADPDKRQMLERLQRAVAQAAEPLEAALPGPGRRAGAGRPRAGEAEVRPVKGERPRQARGPGFPGYSTACSSAAWGSRAETPQVPLGRERGLLPVPRRVPTS